MTSHGLTLIGKNQDLAPNEAAEKIVLTEAALSFVADLVRTFRPRVQELLARRAERQKKLDAGVLPDFLPETANVREGSWRCAAQPDILLDRRVEITGPVDRKMIINALNSGANVFMADFEDSTTPTWKNLVDGQKNLFDAVRRSITRGRKVLTRSATNDRAGSVRITFSLAARSAFFPRRVIPWGPMVRCIITLRCWLSSVNNTHLSPWKALFAVVNDTL